MFFYTLFSFLSAFSSFYFFRVRTIVFPLLDKIYEMSRPVARGGATGASAPSHEPWKSAPCEKSIKINKEIKKEMVFLYFVYLHLMGPPFEDSSGIFLTKLCDSRLILTIHSN